MTGSSFMNPRRRRYRTPEALALSHQNRFEPEVGLRAIPHESLRLKFNLTQRVQPGCHGPHTGPPLPIANLPKHVGPRNVIQVKE